MNAVSAMDENEQGMKSPIKRVGSTRKILIFNNIRQQLNEQLRCLDSRVESQVSLIQELQDFFRRRAELELDYSKSLDKFGRGILLKHKEQKQKREQWPIFSTFNCWQNLVKQTQSLSRDHALLSELYSVNIVANLQTAIEDVQRIYKKSRAIGYEIHEDILRLLQELHTTMKTYQRYENECKAAELKLIAAENQRSKLQQSIPKDKLERSKKYRLTEKEVLKRSTKYSDARLKALRAKNEYQLCLEASNMTIHKYFVEDLSDLIDSMDLGFSSTISRAILMHVTADQARSRKILQQADALSHLARSIDCLADKQRFFEQHHSAFMVPKQLDFQGSMPDIAQEQDISKSLLLDMEQRLQMLEQRLESLKAESDEVYKTLETAEMKLLEHNNAVKFDTSDLFTDEKSASQKFSLTAVSSKVKADKQELEDYYIYKIRDYIKGNSRIARLEAKSQFLHSILSSEDSCPPSFQVKPVLSKRKRIGRINISGQPKLFGGSLEEYLESTGEEIPLIMRSCIRVINLYGLHHQGIFRVSGSQVEISNFREMFEKGEDPLADMTDASDINSIAGVLKLYLRELREPLFPIIYFDYFVSLAELRTKDEIVVGIKKFLQSLPRPVVIVMRYLFAFLNHLAEYADENMMDAYNLAICFGPTLMPAPEDKDQVQYQNQVNELVKSMILYHDELFSKELGGYEYEKYISHEPLIDIDVGDSPAEICTEDHDSEIYPSEDESEILEAVVQFDFNARSSRELTLHRGEYVILRKQVSNDWWQGISNGKEGLIPDKYISLKIKDEERDKSLIKENDITIHSHGEGDELCPSSKEFDTLKISIESDTDNSMSVDLKIDADNKSPNESEFAQYDDLDMKGAFVYHDVPHSFESAMEFQNKYDELEIGGNNVTKKEDPIYSEPIKIHANKNVAAIETECSIEKGDDALLIVPRAFSAESNRSLEGRTSFQQNKKLFEDLSHIGAAGCSSASASPVSQASQASQPSARRKQTAPDLVMDLPAGGSVLCTNANTENFEEEMTSAERFAMQNISTLRKNVRCTTLPAAMSPHNWVHDMKKVSSSNDNILHIKEPSILEKELEVPALAPAASGIPVKNTQKIASNFADLNLTGGYMHLGDRSQLTRLRYQHKLSESSKAQPEPTTKKD